MIYFFILVLSFFIYMLVRNQCVFHTRNKALDFLLEIEDWKHYFDLYDAVSYDDMLLHFWVWPVSKMFPKELQELMENDR
jgi:hypothetical protein